jgi:hypothetical protein
MIGLYPRADRSWGILGRFRGILALGPSADGLGNVGRWVGERRPGPYYYIFIIPSIDVPMHRRFDS